MKIILPLILCFFAYGQIASAQSPTPFKVGVILPLTGPVAEYGVATKNGFELARKEHPDLFSHVQFVYDDSQYDGKKALLSYQKLRNVDGISLLYLWGYGPSQAVTPVTERDRFPLIALSGDASISLGKKFTIRYAYQIATIAENLLTYMRAHNLKRIGILKVEIAYMDGLIEAMQSHLNAGEQIEVVDTFQAGDSDFKTAIAKLKLKKFDAVGVFLMSGQISQFYRQSAQLEFKPRTIGTDFFDSQKEVRDAEGHMEGAVFAAPFADAAFVARYVQQFGNDLQAAWAANGYDFALFIARVFGSSVRPIPADEIIRRLKSEDKELGEATRFKFNKSLEAPAFDVKVVTRTVKAGKIIDLVE
jgi:branched-chain amino acid transport system substrate-binding protein